MKSPPNTVQLPYFPECQELPVFHQDQQDPKKENNV